MPDLNDEQHAAITDAIISQRKIEAIKLYRDATGKGLKEAKEFIEQLQVRLHQEDPTRFPNPKSSGCSMAILAILFMVLVGIITRP